MKIVHVITVDEGGAYKAVERINQCMIQAGIDSSILLRNKVNKKNDGAVFLKNPFQVLKSKFKNGINILLGQGNIIREVLGSDISKNPLVVNADVIFIHWINSFLTVKTLEKLFGLDKKIIIYLHDTWFFTGGCHVNLQCLRYLENCGHCPHIRLNKKKDVSYKNFIDKQRLFEKYSIDVFAPGTDILQKAKNSVILRNQKFYYVPNPIDLNVFYAREYSDYLKYRSNLNKKIILFGAAFNGVQNKAKGFDYLKKALQILNEDYILLVFGRGNEDDLKDLKQEYYLLGYICDDNKMAEIYSAADVYVTPSLQESFGYTILESLACGTPVVSFPNGGSEDLILHKENGYLAEYQNVDSLVKGIIYCTDEVNKEKLKKNAMKSVKKYSYDEMGNMYNKLLFQ